MLPTLSCLTLLLAFIGNDGADAQTTTVSVSATASHSIPTTLFGQMFEDISHSGDGGLYAELLQNRAFQQVAPGTSSASLNAWAAVNGASISVVADTNPISKALPNALAVSVPTGKTGGVGVSNVGFFGIGVKAGTRYNASFFYRFPTSSSFSGPATISLQSSTGQNLGSATVRLSGSQTTFTQVSAVITATTTPSNSNNTFVVTVDGAAASGQTIHFGLFSLFPPTFKNRPNGMRVDIATALQEMGPKFFRFPGGNNVEGQTIATRWQWNNTVGPLENRPGRAGDWGYINTDGLGLFEYLTWCEDLNMEAIMAVWSGYTLSNETVPDGQLQPYIQQAIDQINFAVGPTSTAPGALRASLGHPEPFVLNHVEIGNEDFFATDTYSAYRWREIQTVLKAQFPKIRFLATSMPNDPALSPKPEEWDVHVYNTPTWFAQNAFFYDDFARDGTTYFEGEYAAISTNPNDIFGSPADGRLTFPTVQSSSGEAAFMTGLERNSDIVFAASYAPLLNHVANSQWTPNLVSFDSVNVYRSTSFYVQKLFSLNRGDSYIPSTLPSRNGTIHWSVSRKGSNQIIIKVANTVGNAQTLQFVLPFNTVATRGTLQRLTGSSATTSNTPTTPNAAAPVNSTITVGKNFNYQAPGFSVSVITFTAQ